MLAAALAQQGLAHPGQSEAETRREMQERAEYLSTHRTLADCAEKLEARGNDALLQARRSAKLESLRKKRSISLDKPLLKARSFDDVLNTDHHSNLTVIPETADPAILFTGNASCILTPETTEGPYWVSGELVREDIVEGQTGVPLTLDIQVVDVNTCEPVPQIYTEIWHANSTGVYSGVINPSNGNPNDATNIDNTAFRGIQQTDDDGVVTFDTLFPGHYTNRTTHIHVLTHIDATVLPNNTVAGGTISHVGQLYFDQSLIDLVEKEEPYTTNQQVLLTNAKDSLFSEEAANVDPVVEYVLLGDDISEGVFGWIAFGMDTTFSRNVTPAVYLTENGGVENPNSGNGSGPLPSGPDPTAQPSSTPAA
ncbi:putative extracellular dioxygenase [Bimuria novae-zelandiae CBS 107.79]|uniref:Putative extracellular dioxygenase n=1 Tax=Bimuria novae-zelandiae CBS 107.79 TaxID=1447943 RepID=A0A6A5V662_9PLEO|nr:putative extracellular dioxygenase [Bimuria novae-zelandiae CBS 107.79]